MKKIISILIALVSLVSVMCFSACGKNDYMEAVLFGNTYVFKDITLEFAIPDNIAKNSAAKEAYKQEVTKSAENKFAEEIEKAKNDNKDVEYFFDCTLTSSFYKVNGGEKQPIHYRATEKMGGKWIGAALEEGDKKHLYYDKNGDSFYYIEELGSVDSSDGSSLIYMHCNFIKK